MEPINNCERIATAVIDARKRAFRPIGQLKKRRVGSNPGRTYGYPGRDGVRAFAVP